ncbi:hypothetical protein KCP73_01795 [Salmonella enterica subsp. enterica]|nr:hypothetical protein KCP73_01795 [Salmonella enterica subsp. enterica]
MGFKIRQFRPFLCEIAQRWLFSFAVFANVKFPSFLVKVKTPVPEKRRYAGGLYAGAKPTLPLLPVLLRLQEINIVLLGAEGGPSLLQRRLPQNDGVLYRSDKIWLTDAGLRRSLPLVKNGIPTAQHQYYFVSLICTATTWIILPC